MPLLTETQRENAEQHHMRKAKREVMRQALGIVNEKHFRRPDDNTRGHVFPIFHGLRNEAAKNELMRQVLDVVNMTHFGMPPFGRRGLSTFPIAQGSRNAFYDRREQLLRQINDATDHISALRARIRNHRHAEPDDANSDEWVAWFLKYSDIENAEEEEAEWVQWRRDLYDELSALGSFATQVRSELFAARRIDL